MDKLKKFIVSQEERAIFDITQKRQRRPMGPEEEE
jgi:hypothetical protein